MSYRLLFIVNAFVVFVLGVALIFAPSMVLEQFRMDARATEVLLSRFVGAALATVGLLLWFAKDGTEETMQKNLVMAALAGSVLALIVTVIGVAGGMIRSNGWIALVVEVLFALGYAFMLFLQPRMNSLLPQSPPSAR